MSCDTGKENASAVNSSLTDLKQDMGNMDDPVSSRLKENEDGNRRGAEGRGHSPDCVRNVRENEEGRLYGTRYFIIKSLNHQNLQLSIDRGIWATQVMNEPILDEAFHNSGKVILIFSVNMSGFFQGYAQMASSVGWRRDSVWSQGIGGNNPWGRNFKVKWLCLRDLPFQRTLHLKNPLNDYKPVKISRDCQELPEDIGEALCELLDGNLNVNDVLNGNEFLCNGFPSKRTCMEPPYSVRDDIYNFPPMHMNWDKPPMFHPSLHCPQEGEASTLHHSGSSRDAYRKQSRTNGRLDLDISSRSEVWGLSAEESPLSTLTEDDFLEMSYEEYLEAHSRSRKHNSDPVAVKPRSVQETTASKEHDDASSSRYRGDRYHSNKRSHHSSHK